MRPKVSVIIPIYNVEKYLTECLDSVLGQSLEDIEIVCVEDCSTDNSLQILDKHAKIDSRIITVINNENRGLSYSRNQGIMHASGKYVCFVDSDDMLRNDALSDLFTYAEDNKTDIVFFNMETISDDLVLTNEEKKLCSSGDFIGVKTGIEFAMEGGIRNTACLQFWNFESYRKYNMGFMKGILHEDVLFTFQGIMKAERVGFINEQYYVYRRHKNSITKREITSVYVESYIRIYKEILKYLDNNLNNDSSFIVMQYLRNIESQIVKYVDQLKGGISQLLEEWGKTSELCFWLDTIIARYIVGGKGMFTGTKLYSLYVSNKKIILYGAGLIARKCIEVLRRYNILIDGIVVSDINDNPYIIDGIRVYDTKYLLDNNDKCIVVVAVGKVYKDEVIALLKKMQIKEYITLS